MTELRQRQPRLIDEGYLRWLRSRSCVCGCHRGPPCDAHHIRPASLQYGKPFTGKTRPDDRWCVPLLHEHHMALHAHGGELEWWEQHGVNPFDLAIRLYAEYGGDGGKPRTKRPRAKKAAPKIKRRIPSRPFPSRSKRQ